MIPRYRSMDDERDDDGEFVLYADHVASVKRLVEALRDARYWICSADDKHSSRCAFICKSGELCDCGVPQIDAALEEAEHV